MENKKEIALGLRLASMIVDHVIMSFIIMIPMIPTMIISMIKLTKVTHDLDNLVPFFAIYIFIFGLAIYFNKDFFNGRSISKRILKLQVVDYKDNIPASPLKCLVRNLTIILWPIEVIFVLINPQRRLGDYIAGTKIINYDPENHTDKRKIKEYILTVSISILIPLLLSLGFKSIEDIIDPQYLPYDEKSYNSELSAELSNFLTDNMGEICEKADVRYYDSIRYDSLKYISVLFYIGCLDLYINEIEAQELKEMIVDTLSLKIPKESFRLKGKIIEDSPGKDYVEYIEYNPLVNYSTNYGGNSYYINDSTRIIKGFYENGIQESEAVYIHGKLSGTYKEWYESGNLKIEIEYQNGMRNGSTTTYYVDGSKKIEMLYENNFYVRDINKWDENGNELPFN